MGEQMGMERLSELVRIARRLYEANCGSEWVVSPAAPALFFGDLPRFEASQIRVATVGLNPSRLEFPSECPFRRFPGADSHDESSYLSALFAYFRNSPYKSWFGFYEQALLGMGVSYYGALENVALHTDIGSVIPTDPTWSGLAPTIRRQLAHEGVTLWHCLLEHIQPDILLQSTARCWLGRIEWKPLTQWDKVHTFDMTGNGEHRKRPIELQVRWHSLDTGKPFLVAYVPAAQKPMAGLSHEQKRQAGRIVMERWQHGIR